MINKKLTEQEKKDWAMWYNHKSGKEIWIEEQERLEDEKLNDCTCGKCGELKEKYGK